MFFCSWFSMYLLHISDLPLFIMPFFPGHNSSAHKYSRLLLPPQTELLQSDCVWAWGMPGTLLSLAWGADGTYGIRYYHRPLHLPGGSRQTRHSRLIVLYSDSPAGQNGNQFGSGMIIHFLGQARNFVLIVTLCPDILLWRQILCMEILLATWTRW